MFTLLQMPGMFKMFLEHCLGDKKLQILRDSVKLNGSKRRGSLITKKLLADENLAHKMEITLMFISFLKKNKVIDIFRDISFEKKDRFLENLMKPEYQKFIKDKGRMRKLNIQM